MGNYPKNRKPVSKEVRERQSQSQPERVKRDKELERYVLSTGRQIVWLWNTEILDEWFDIEDYLKGGDVK